MPKRPAKQKHRPPFTEEERAEIVSAYKGGMGWRQVMAKFGVSGGSLSAWLNAAGVQRQFRSKRHSATVANKALQAVQRASGQHYIVISPGIQAGVTLCHSVDQALRIVGSLAAKKQDADLWRAVPVSFALEVSAKLKRKQRGNG